MQGAEVWRVKEVQKGYRSLVAKRDLKQGQRVIDCEPLAWATLKGMKAQVCSWCLMRREVVRCGRCKSFYYCSGECQRKDWPIHKLECPIYQRMASQKQLSIHKQIATEFVLNLRLALILQQQPKVREQFSEMVNLQEHQPAEKLQHMMELSVVLLENMGEGRDQQKITKMMSQLNRVAVNAFTIQDLLCETDGVGVGIYWPANYINHDCQPNCTQYFDGRHLHIVTNQAILSGQELTISYISPLSLVAQRRNKLRQTYLFQCFCQLCQVESMLDSSLSHLICPSCQGAIRPQEGDPPSFVCTECEEIFSKSDLQDMAQKCQEEMELYGKVSDHSTMKKMFFALKKKVSLTHPFFSEAIEQLTTSTLHQLEAASENPELQSKLMEQVYILLRQSLKGALKWYHLDEEEGTKTIRFLSKYAQLGKVCYNLKKIQKAFDYTERAFNIASQCRLRNRYPEVDELKQRHQELTIELSIAKSRSFNHRT